MNTINRFSAAILLAAALTMISPAAWPLGLGEASVESYLNQPLQARIDLISQQSDDLTSVSAGLASADDYELIGASRESVSVPLAFTIEGGGGDAWIAVSSKLPISDPVLRLIVEVNWANGRLLREYTLFLDPPAVPQQAPAPRMDLRKDPPAPAPTPAAESPPPAPAAQPPQPEAAPPPASEPAAQPSTGDYGPVQSGDTLWKIARDWSRGSDLDINKVMIAIQRENPSAFINDNINLLRRGAILRMPQAGDVNSISTAAAIEEVTEQENAFYGRRSREPIASPATPLMAEESAPVETPAAPRSEAAPRTPDEAPASEPEAAEPESDPGTAQAAEPPDQLELVPPSAESDLDSAYGFEEAEDNGADAAVTASALRENLARTEEELINQRQQNEYLEDRIRELESRLASAEAATVEDAELAGMQERLREQRQQQAAQAPAAETPRVVSRPAEAPPWYRRYALWLVILLVLLAAGAGWLISRRSGGDEVVSDLGAADDPIREIKDEAEQVLRVLEDSGDEESQAAATAEPADAEETVEEDGEGERDDEDQQTVVRSFGTPAEDDAELLDEESSDPEIQLDLARAYISMGDKEAARVILDEVTANGSEEQKAEAQKMLDLLT